MTFVSYYAVVVSLPRHANFGGLPLDAKMKVSGAESHCGVLVIDLRNSDIVQWFHFTGKVTELFDVGGVPNIRCLRAIGPSAPGLEGDAGRGARLARSHERHVFAEQLLARARDSKSDRSTRFPNFAAFRSQPRSFI